MMTLADRLTVCEGIQVSLNYSIVVHGCYISYLSTDATHFGVCWLDVDGCSRRETSIRGGWDRVDNCTRLCVAVALIEP